MTKKKILAPRKETLGKIAREIMEKPQDSRDPIELAKINEQDYIKNLFECLETHKQIFKHSDFFVEVLTKKEPLIKNVVRNYFAGRLACPTPFFDQSVYQYHWYDDKLELLWALPVEEACRMYRNYALEVVPEERALLGHILDYYDGTLLRLAMKLNGETLESPQIELKIIQH